MKKSIKHYSKTRRAAYLVWRAYQKSLRPLKARPEAAEPGYVARTWSTGQAYRA